jgi:hypothetical protein
MFSRVRDAARYVGSTAAAYPFGGSRNIEKFLREGEEKHRRIIAGGPPVPFFGAGRFESRKANEEICFPRKPLPLIDGEGHETEFLFQSDSIHSRPDDAPAEMIFYSEIAGVHFTAIPGFGNEFVQMTFDTQMGFRTFFFFPRIYCNLARRVLDEQRDA